MKALRKPQSSYLATLLGGTAGMILSNLLLAPPLSTWVLLGCPLAAMVVHTLAMVARDVGARYSGDSIYFLGFSFTLVSLILAFFPAVGGTRDISVPGVVEAFMVALITTVAGLVARIALFDPDDSTEPEDVRSEVRAMLIDLRTELDESLLLLRGWRIEHYKVWEDYKRDQGEKNERLVEELATLRSRLSAASADLLEETKLTNQQLQESLHRSVSSIMQQAGEGVTRALEAVRQEAWKAGRLLSEALTGELEGLFAAQRKAIEAGMQGLGESSQQFVNELQDQHKESLAAIGANAQEATHRLTTLVSSLQASIKTSESELQAVTAGVSSNIADLGEDFSDLRRKLRGAGEGLGEALEDHVSRSLAASEGLAQLLEERKSVFANALDSLAQDLRRAKPDGVLAGIEAMEDALRRADQAIRQSVGTHSQMMTSAGKNLQDATTAFERCLSVLQDWNGSLDRLRELPELLRSSTTEMLQDVRVSQTALREVMTTISSGVASLRQEIQHPVRGANQ